MSTSTIRVSVYKDSLQPFTALLQEGNVEFNMCTPPVGVVMNAGWSLDIVLSPAIIPSLAMVICVFLKNRRSRKVIITTHDDTVIHAEGLSQSEVERLIAQTTSLIAIETAGEKSRSDL